LNASVVKELAGELGRPCLVPVVSTLKSCPDPAKVYFTIRTQSNPSYLLESAEGPGEAARYSIIGCNPLLYVRVRGGECAIGGRQDLVELARGKAEQAKRGGDALEVLKKAMLLEDMHVPEVGPRYMFGTVGCIGYDFVRSMVDVGNHAADDLRQPELEFMLPELMIIFDHLARQSNYCSLMLLLDGSDVEEAYGRALSNLKELKRMEKISLPAKKRVGAATSSNIERGKFESNVERAKHYIRAGDVIQVVLSRRIELDPSPPLGQFYTNLRRINPSPYMFFLDFPERSVVGSSPEILVKVEGERVVTRPIAGTRRRGRSPMDDAAMERELRWDEKERAEHVMLVDLGRNDIGRVSEFGSVEVTEFMKVEKYSHVQHLVTNVVGRIRKDKDAFDALQATFPAGTVTGAPKVRAMEIIDELEPTRRGIYAGAIGSFSYTGDADLAITIRTLVAEGGKGYVQVGAGIVADSIPWKEHYETENKARALLRAAGV
jgi:anthranilate synthase component 1